MKIITIFNTSSQPVSINIDEDINSELFTGSGMTAIAKGKSITVEEKRINFSVLQNMKKLGLVKSRHFVQRPTPVSVPEEVLSMAVTADMGAGFGAVEHEQTLVGAGLYAPDDGAVQFTIRVTNTSDALLTLSNVSITGAGLGPTSLEITPPVELEIPVGEFADFIVDFIAPGIGQAGEGTYTAQITFEHGASNEPSPFEINLNLDCIGAAN